MVSDILETIFSIPHIRLNPCSNGIWSLTCIGFIDSVASRHVLILVLMEYGL